MTDSQQISLIDSHCHLNLIDLNDFNNHLDHVIHAARAAGVKRFLCVSVGLEDYPILTQLTQQYEDVDMSVGVHPDSPFVNEPDAAKLCQLASHPRCIAIGETGLDYYRTEQESDRLLQQQRFREHIRASISTGKPLIIHTRQAADDTIRILREEKADSIGGVMHCFTETWEVARQAIDLNFYISFSGIVTFKNAAIIQDVAKRVPSDRMLIETDAPYLAPVPHRGKQNHPALVRHVAEALAVLRDTNFETVAAQTTANFYRCFRLAE